MRAAALLFLSFLTAPALGQPAHQEPPLTPPSVSAQMSDAQIAASMEAWLGDLNARGNFDGAVLIARDGKEIFAHAYGLAHRHRDIGADVETRYPLASIGKLFTAIAVAQLEQAGKLHGSDTLGALIPDYPNSVSRAATIDQLLNMQAGVGDAFGPAFLEAGAETFASNADYYRFVSQAPSEFAPGARTQYCNGCYIVLGEIVARIAGMGYEDYIAQNIIAPLGMSRTGFVHRNAPPPDTATFYGSPRGPGGAIVDVSEFHGLAGSAAGNIYSTLRDLLKLDNALREHRLLNAQYTAQVLQAAPEAGRATKRIGFAGGGPGVNTMLHGNGAWTLIVLANREPPQAEAVDAAVFPLLAGPAAP